MPTDTDLPTPAEILEIHEEVESEYDLTHTGTRGAAPEARLAAVVESAEDHDDLYRRAATLLRRLITAHVFEDGNKRTAWATTWLYLERHGLTPTESGESVAPVLRRIRRYSTDELATWLETGDLDRSRLEP